MTESAVNFFVAGLLRAFGLQLCFRNCHGWEAGDSSSPIYLATVSCSAYLVNVGNSTEEIRTSEPTKVTLKKYLASLSLSFCQVKQSCLLFLFRADEAAFCFKWAGHAGRSACAFLSR